MGPHPIQVPLSEGWAQGLSRCLLLVDELKLSVVQWHDKNGYTSIDNKRLWCPKEVQKILRFLIRKLHEEQGLEVLSVMACSAIEDLIFYD